MKCFQCGKSGDEGPLLRVNEKGVPGIWACMAHRTKVDPEVDALVSVIAAAGATPATPPLAGLDNKEPK